MTAAAARAPNARVWPAVWKLLRLRWQISFNSFRRAKLLRKIFTGVAFLGMLLLIGIVFFSSWRGLAFIRSPELRQYLGDTTALIAGLPALILLAASAGILLTSFGVLLQALYMAGDMDFLLTAPVPIRAVFVAKLLQAIFPNLGLVALFGLPVLYGLGVVEQYNFLYYLFVPIMMAALCLAAAGLAALLVMVVARIFPARRVVEVLGFLGAIFSILCSQMSNLTRFGAEDTALTGEQARGLYALAVSLNTPWLPLTWAGRGLTAVGEGRWGEAALLLGVMLGLAAAIFTLALVTAERWYYTGWASMQLAPRKKKTPRPENVPTTLPWFQRLLPAPVRALLQKDFLVLRRDLRQLSQLITPLIFGVVYAVMFLRSGEPAAGQGEAPAWFMESLRSVWGYGNVFLGVLVSWMLSNRLAGMAFSQEGRNYWLLKTAPVRVEYLLLAKFLVAYLPALLLGELFLTALALLQSVPLGNLLYSLVAVAFCLAGMDGILLAFGALGANFTWEDPRRMNAGNMGCLGQVLAMLFIPLALGLFLGPVLFLAFLGWSPAYGYTLGVLLGGGVCTLSALGPLGLVRRKVERLGES